MRVRIAKWPNDQKEIERRLCLRDPEQVKRPLEKCTFAIDDDSDGLAFYWIRPDGLELPWIGPLIGSAKVWPALILALAEHWIASGGDPDVKARTTMPRTGIPQGQEFVRTDVGMQNTGPWLHSNLDLLEITPREVVERLQHVAVRGDV